MKMLVKIGLPDKTGVSAVEEEEVKKKTDISMVPDKNRLESFFLISVTSPLNKFGLHPGNHTAKTIQSSPLSIWNGKNVKFMIQ
ncbi:hypothetical protein MHI37_02600 [Paenibacillus sp. FSL H8-0548]|uniref:hypothetical protein n=1 Tax=Paenibacillus sp. FSL H8-0548 TaxID=1920422 RepID=UPI002116E075|nr:hypothetical protein [Paenibacillus sp. FSL H8-0548]